MVEGIKVVNELLIESPEVFESVYHTADWKPPRELKGESPIEMHEVKLADLQKVTAFKNAQAVLAVVRPQPARPDIQSLSSHFSLYLDGIRDPGNVGTIFRIADWFGFQNVIVSEDCADVFNPKVIQASMGSVFRIKWTVAALSEVASSVDVPVYNAVLGGREMTGIDFTQPGLVVLGNEARGIQQVIDSDRSIDFAISSRHNLGADSLNVAVSAGIICAHIRSHNS